MGTIFFYPNLTTSLAVYCGQARPNFTNAWLAARTRLDSSPPSNILGNCYLSRVFLTIDGIFNQILSFSPYLPPRRRLHHILNAIIIFREPTIATLSDLLELDQSELSLFLQNLKDLVKIEELPTVSLLTPTNFPILRYL